MTKGRLTKRERKHYEAGGFRLDGRPRSAAAAERAHLDVAIRILKVWGAGSAALRATLAIPSARALGAWRRGDQPVPPTTRERVAVVIAIYARLAEANDHLDLKPLPPLQRAGRKSLSARAVLAGGRLSDLLALWRQRVLLEERAEQRERRKKARRQRPGRKAEAAR